MEFSIKSVTLSPADVSDFAVSHESPAERDTALILPIPALSDITPQLGRREGGVATGVWIQDKLYSLLYVLYSGSSLVTLKSGRS